MGSHPKATLMLGIQILLKYLFASPTIISTRPIRPPIPPNIHPITTNNIAPARPRMASAVTAVPDPPPDTAYIYMKTIINREAMPNPVNDIVIIDNIENTFEGFLCSIIYVLYHYNIKKSKMLRRKRSICHRNRGLI